ncbi:MAG TPA: glycerol-3-phosphate dehydrogenase/oxidase [Acidimicrobiales bacterium]|nr:glycerol-3-phosphate dehydrogenase/oxidase [Acidimicrobiales bacterium]
MATFRRSEELRTMSTARYDVVVIGAGMTGAGVALDAASRGLRVALIDRGDFASGTSSKSSKMVHGGLRYLQQREFRLVYESLRERQRLLRNAPYLIQPLPFLIPLFGSNGVASSAVVKGYATALRIYDLSGGWRIGHRYRRITRAEALSHLPTLRTEKLVAGFLYYDAQGDDARVALTLAKTAAVTYRANVANYVRAVDVVKGSSGRVEAVLCHDEISGEEFSVATKSVVNATGVWANDIFTMTEHDSTRRITPAKGVHVTVARDRLPADVATILNVPNDRRNIFVVPFYDAPYTYVGTTDTAYQGSLDDPRCTPEDVAYLLGAVNASTSSALGTTDVTAVWAGLRPLLAPTKGEAMSERTADLSRRHRVIDSGDGVVHVTGGKWTTYRQMAEDAVDALKPYVANLAKVRTKSLPLYGVSAWRPSGGLEEHLYHRFGANAPGLIESIQHDPILGETPIAGQPYVAAEFVFSAREEMVMSLTDLLTRRTRAHLLDARATLAGAPDVARLVAPELNWDQDQIEGQVNDYRTLVEVEFSAAGLEL